MYLTGYTIKKNADLVGKLHLRNGVVSTVRLSGPDAAAFEIKNGGDLYVRRNKAVSKKEFNITLTANAVSSKDFKIIADEFLQNKVIAHRGAWKNTHVPENSIAALEHAFRLGCEGSEFDVHMSSDSVPMIHHDADVKGVSIAKTDSRELLKLQLENGEVLPTLERYLKAGVKQNKTRLILEIKSSELGKESSIALTGRTVALVESLQAQAWVDYIAFDYDVCREVIKLAPYAKVQYLNGDKSPADVTADKLTGLDYHYSVWKLNPAWISEAKSHQLVINVWTVNSEVLMKEFLEKNVDQITTNEPELLFTLLKK